MAEGHNEIIIVRRHEEDEHEHHSSAWKVAHADFMTAMMAFFLIMWLINVTDDKIRKGISQYFNPIHLSEGSTDMKGLNEPDPEKKAEGKKGHAETAPVFNPVTLSQGHAESKQLDPKDAAAAAAAAPRAAAPAAEAGKAGQAAERDAGKAAGGEADAGVNVAATRGAAASGIAKGAPGSGEAERAAFQDPYAILAQLAEEYSAEHAISADVVVGDDRRPGFAGGEVDRDPFDPVYWQLADVPPARTDQPGEPGLAKVEPEDVLPDAAALVRKTETAAKLDSKPVELPAKAVTPEKTDETASEPPAAPEASELPAATKPSEPPASQTPPVASTGGPDSATVVAAETLKAEIAGSIKETMAGVAAPNLTVKATAEGILIDLTDDADFSMFEVGSAIPDPTVVVLMERIAKILAEKPGNIIVRGHSDGRPFRSDVYDNWRLSAGRAHMAYYMLTRGGLAEKRVARIEGYADHALKVPTDPYAAENRRIEILLVGAE